MKKLPLLFLLLFTLPVVAQQERRLYYDSTWKESSVIQASYYRIITGDSVNGLKDTIRDYYITGQPEGKIPAALKINVSDDRKSVFTGTVTRYYKSGKRKGESVYDKAGNTQLNRAWYENGQLSYTIPFKDGKKNGDARWYYPGGQPKAHVLYVNGKSEGIDSAFYEDGKTEALIPYFEGWRNGEARWFYDSGQVKETVTYAAGTITSPDKTFYPNGKPESITPYANGKKNGQAEYYYNNGQLLETDDYVNGKLDGYIIKYWENGKLQEQQAYTKGDASACSCFDTNGIRVSCHPHTPSSTINADTLLSRGVIPPKFPDGDVGVYIGKRLNYPPSARMKDASGTVYLSFVVDVDGSVKSVRVLRGVRGAPELDDEAVRVVSALPKWKPATLRGIPVKMTLNIPVNFILIERTHR